MVALTLGAEPPAALESEPEDVAAALELELELDPQAAIKSAVAIVTSSAHRRRILIASPWLFRRQVWVLGAPAVLSSCEQPV